MHTPRDKRSAQQSPLEIYPNPANDLISISYPLQTAIQQINIRNISGQLIQSIHPTDKANIDISALSNGVYILEIQAGGNMIYRKLVKQ